MIKNLPANAGDIRDWGSILGLGRSSEGWRGTPVFFPGGSHGQRSLEGYSPWGHRESDMTEATAGIHTVLGGVALGVVGYHWDGNGRLELCPAHKLGNLTSLLLVQQ